MTDKDIRTNFDNIYSDNRELQNEAFRKLLEITDQPVSWAYDMWDDMIESLGNNNNRVRAITSQILINLANRDQQKRILSDFDSLLDVTKDERFVSYPAWCGVVSHYRKLFYCRYLDGSYYPGHSHPP